jgi:photosystem II stability/assembly factor-like uncharacterized protein
VARVALALAAVLLATGLAASGTRASAGPARPWFDWLHMTSAKDGYALSGRSSTRYLLLRTSDGGHIWRTVTAIHPSAPPSVEGATILFSRSVGRHAFAVERSDDGGRTWRESVPVRNRFGVGAGTPRAVDRRHLYVEVGEGAAAGSEGEALYTSSDGGRHWHLESQTNVDGTRPGGLPFGCDKDGFGFSTPNRGWAGGYCAGGSPFFLRTTDGGRTWHSQRLPGAPRSCACETSTPTFFTRRVGVVSLSGIANGGAGKPFARVYWTADGGDTWRGSDPTSGRTGPVDIASPHVVWLFGRLAGDAPRFPRLFRTSDAGRHWSSRHLPVNVGGDSPDAVTATLGFVASGRSMWRTTDGGRHWTAIRAVIARR